MTFQHAILSSSQICSNCFRRRRREAVRPREYEPDETYDERIRWRTSVEDVPDVVVREQQAVFCECGVDSPYARIWDEDEGDVDDERFAELLTNALVTLVRLEEISTRPEARRIAERAWATWREGATVNEALSAGVDEPAEQPPVATAD